MEVNAQFISVYQYLSVVELQENTLNKIFTSTLFEYVCL